MQDDWTTIAILGAMVLFALSAGILVLRRMRARRAELFAEQPLDVPHGEPSEPPRQAVAGAAAEQLPQEATAVPSAAATTAAAEPTAPAPVRDLVLQAGLAKTQASFLGRITQIFSRTPRLDAHVLDELEEVLLTADVGVTLATKFMDDLRQRLKAGELQSVDDVTQALRRRLLAAFGEQQVGDPLAVQGSSKPRVILFVGVNGVGKTTTIGKLASQLKGRGHKVLLAAGDTFRAAAAEQLVMWGERSGARVVRGDEGSDPASVIFNAVEAGKQTGMDIVLADTAGRLHTKVELMDEIRKVRRAAGKAREGAPDETWLVVDATTGQNALQQAREFHQTLGLTGVVLTKLDGTAKGGVVVAIVDALQIPVRFVGVGEKAEDLRPFNPESFVAALFDGPNHG